MEYYERFEDVPALKGDCDECIKNGTNIKSEKDCYYDCPYNEKYREFLKNKGG